MSKPAIRGCRSLMNSGVVPNNALSVTHFDSDTREYLRTEVVTWNTIDLDTPDRIVIVGYNLGMDFDTFQSYAKGLNNWKVLDVIYAWGNRYRSALCSNEECCPVEGNPFGEPESKPEGKPKGKGLLAYSDRVEAVVTALRDGVEPTDFREVVETIRERDALLVEAGKDLSLFEAILRLTRGEDSAQAWAVRSAAFFALGDSDAALDAAEEALAIDPSLPFARLLHNAVSGGAPASMLLAALAAAEADNN